MTNEAKMDAICLKLGIDAQKSVNNIKMNFFKKYFNNN